ncbi:Cytoplasmic dynein 1 heavy chain 1 [Phytophthora cinnamomi]|uniref:Cytoplasmic dynein 1 heavy chain 1 n=1 Tax=Phytophthora cinnamomi TaxID=4785 RepID=UPI00355A1AB4|nr:Cytoplasmic dynein 1 heavy chain 1 [Phytophthora cinnamomi]
MSLDPRPADFSEGEDEELMFAFEEEQEEHAAVAVAFSPRLRSGGSRIFHSIDGVDVERPANPMAAVLARREKAMRKRGRDDEEDEPEEPEALDTEDRAEEKPAAPVFRRKRNTFDLPTGRARVIRPVAKRLKSNAYERSVTAPACLMGNLSLHRTRDQQQDDAIPELESEADHKSNAPFRSASINIPDSFQPIHWPGDAAVACSSGRERSQSCSSSSSSKSWASGLGLFCRRSLDVSSPLRVHFNDLVLHSSTGSYTGS